jgi:hypothetical protein
MSKFQLKKHIVSFVANHCFAQYPNGGSYVYADANAPAFQKSSHSVDSASSGALALTISQV